MGIEPTWLAWKARALPLSYTRWRKRWYSFHIINLLAAFLPEELFLDAAHMGVVTNGKSLLPDSK